ncbi:MAG TPA: winged helix-turn-helix transcriptional regulator [Euryarchaeota archaeon]|nr:winged helix-turn-helix transcriptional regulator [Euryarchaeota archaeon]
MNPKIFFFLIFLIIPCIYGEETQELTITVYRDGYCHISQVLSVDEDIMISILVFGENLDNILITGEKEILDYDISGNEIIIDTENNTKINIEYDTPDLTSKEGIVWTLEITSPMEFTVIFPEGITVIDLNNIPLEISENKIKVSKGDQKISYFFTAETREQSKFVYPLMIIGVILFCLGVYILQRKKIKFSKLTNEEKEVIEFLKKNGDSLSSDIRKSLNIPKTTAWRLFKRLEEKEIIEIKKGKENYIKLKRL